MTRPVSVVLPSLADTALLETALPELLAEVDRRGLGDEVVVVDDSGEGVLAPWLAERFPAVVAVTREENGGFAPALRDGVERARHPLVFSMNTDVVVRPGFLDPLVACLDDPEVFAAVPRVLLHGEEDRVESLTEMEWKDGVARFRQPSLEGASEAAELALRPGPVAFAVGGTVLLRREELLAEDGGFDALFRPFYWEDIDLSWRAWRQGRRVLYQPSSVVEHQHRKSIGAVVSPEVVTAALEKNRWLFHWKHVDEADLAEHVAALHRVALDAYLGDDRETLEHLCLALEEVDRALASRRALPAAKLSFREICERSRPGTDG